jgi:hypothetical protein
MALNAGPLHDFMLVLVVMNKSALLRETVSDTFLQQFSSRRLDRLNQKLPNNNGYNTTPPYSQYVMKTFLPNPDKDQKQSAATTGATQGVVKHDSVMFFNRH